MNRVFSAILYVNPLKSFIKKSFHNIGFTAISIAHYESSTFLKLHSQHMPLLGVSSTKRPQLGQQYLSSFFHIKVASFLILALCDPLCPGRKPQCTILSVDKRNIAQHLLFLFILNVFHSFD
jgi:hypothetical protein